MSSARPPARPRSTPSPTRTRSSSTPRCGSTSTPRGSSRRSTTSCRAARSRVMAVADSLVLTGTAYSAADGDDIRNIAARFVKDPKQLVNKMQVDAPNQVNLRVRVAEVSRDVVKEFGINWQNASANGSHPLRPRHRRGRADLDRLPCPCRRRICSGSRRPPSPQVGQLIPQGATGTGFNVLKQSQLGGQTNNNLFAGVRTRYAQPQRADRRARQSRARHGARRAQPHRALGRAGELPRRRRVPGPGPGRHRPRRHRLQEVRRQPQLRRDRRERRPHQPACRCPRSASCRPPAPSSIDGISVPALTTRRAETTVELASGQSFAIGGLLQNNVTQNINKFPWLGDVPVLGQLFRSEAFQRHETELVIIVTPYLVHPIATASRAHGADRRVRALDRWPTRAARARVPVACGRPRRRPAAAARTSSAPSASISSEDKMALRPLAPLALALALAACGPLTSSDDQLTPPDPMTAAPCRSRPGPVRDRLRAALVRASRWRGDAAPDLPRSGRAAAGRSGLYRGAQRRRAHRAARRSGSGAARAARRRRRDRSRRRASIQPDHIVVLADRYVVTPPTCAEWSGPSATGHSNVPNTQFRLRHGDRLRADGGQSARSHDRPQARPRRMRSPPSKRWSATATEW